MSDALDRVAGADELPIFPLPLVMLPNEVLPLHIFEDRYIKMLADVTTGRNLFGISLFEPSEMDDAGRPGRGSIGCAAEVRETDALPDGRSNIVTLGIIRYRIIDYVESSEPYLVAEVGFFEDEANVEPELAALADEVFGLFERMAKAAFKMGGSRGQVPQIQQADPQSLSFLVTAAFSFDNEFKYKMLEITSTAERLRRLRELLIKAVDKMEESADIQTTARLNGHSKKKLDI